MFTARAAAAPWGRLATLRQFRALTYTTVTFRGPGGSVDARALVDTGSTDCELRAAHVERLRLPVAGEERYETATGWVTEATYQVEVSVGGRSCKCVLTSIPDSRFEGPDACTDEALLGHTAISRLGVGVDCASRSLRCFSGGSLPRQQRPRPRRRLRPRRRPRARPPAPPQQLQQQQRQRAVLTGRLLEEVCIR
eukprot:TRINITY_DN19158_c0_g1_i1.p1 TRINITY_DN19158_c0_g1~~TRINITY_DN19158_c0_g1_i1.p1  ORF type:complete len:219 (+),score=73.47 TRINITY_DN19158_c0_g1_i1:73-657(+)